MKLKKIIRNSMIALALLEAGCSLSRKALEYNPVQALEEATLPALNDPEIIEFYKKYFPKNNPGISLNLKKRNADIKFFINPKVKLKDNIEYQVMAGFELKY